MEVYVNRINCPYLLLLINIRMTLQGKYSFDIYPCEKIIFNNTNSLINNEHLKFRVILEKNNWKLDNHHKQKTYNGFGKWKTKRGVIIRQLVGTPIISSSKRRPSDTPYTTTTKRASRMIVQPVIHASLMENMIALWTNLTLITVPKLLQAYNTSTRLIDGIIILMAFIVNNISFESCPWDFLELGSPRILLHFVLRTINDHPLLLLLLWG